MYVEAEGQPYPVVGMEIVAWILQKHVVKWRAPTGTGSLRPRNTDTEGEWRIFNKGAQQARVYAAKKFGARTRAPPAVRTKGSEPSLAKQVVSIFCTLAKHFGGGNLSKCWVASRDTGDSFAWIIVSRRCSTSFAGLGQGPLPFLEKMLFTMLERAQRQRLHSWCRKKEATKSRSPWLTIFTVA